MTYIVLDLFCGAGGITKGLQRAGFHVVGVDSRAQPHYCGDEFIQADAMDCLRYLAGELATGVSGWLTSSEDFDAIHASPPCEHFSPLAIAAGVSDRYPNLIPEVRRLLRKIGLPYSIENVIQAPLENPLLFCGASFGLEVIRHRHFELSFPCMTPGCGHLFGGTTDGTYVAYSQVGNTEAGRARLAARGRKPRPRELSSEWRDAAGLYWMNRDEAGKAIPPAYSEHIGHYLLVELDRANSAIAPAA